MFTHRFNRLAAIVCAAAGLAFGSSVPAAAQDQDLQKITMILDWFVNPDHAPLVVAKQKGYFADEGLDVELIAPADPNDPPKLVAAGKADVAVGYQPQLHLQAAEGLPVKRVSTLVATPLNSLVTLADSGINTLSDLKGRTVGFSVGGFEDALLGTMLNSVGLSLDDVELVNVNFALSPALLSGQVDAVIGAFRNFELNQLAIEGATGIAFYPEEHGVPAYDELILLVNAERADDPVFAKLVDAIERGTQFLINHPDKSWELFIEAYPDLDDELNRRAWTDTLPRFALTPAALDSGRYDRFAQYLKDQGMIDEVPPVSSYAVSPTRR